MAKKAAVKKKPTPPAKKRYKYGVPELAKALGIQDASVRVALRNHEIAKTKDGVYGWDDESGFKRVKDKLSPAEKKK